MRGRGITAACLRMARLVVGRVIRWLDMRRIGVLCPWRLRRFLGGWRSEKGRGRNLRFRFRWLRFIMREFRICLWNQNSDRRKAWKYDRARLLECISKESRKLLLEATGTLRKLWRTAIKTGRLARHSWTRPAHVRILWSQLSSAKLLSLKA